MQPLVLRDAGGEIIAFSILYVNREKGYAVLNDVEMDSKYDGFSKQKQVKAIYNALINGVNAFANQYNIENPYYPIYYGTSQPSFAHRDGYFHPAGSGCICSLAVVGARRA
jgi:hypothetical protein